jgi:hypothetical protein
MLRRKTAHTFCIFIGCRYKHVIQPLGHLVVPKHTSTRWHKLLLGQVLFSIWIRIRILFRLRSDELNWRFNSWSVIIIPMNYWCLSQHPFLNLDLFRFKHLDVFVASWGNLSAVDALAHVLAVFEEASLHVELLTLDAHLNPIEHVMLETLIMHGLPIPVPWSLICRCKATLGSLLGLTGLLIHIVRAYPISPIMELALCLSTVVGMLSGK